MIIEQLMERSSGTCEVCTSAINLALFDVGELGSFEDAVLLCDVCVAGHRELQDENHWRSLQSAIWSEIPAVQVLSWRLLTRLSKNHAWALEVLESAYVEDAILLKATSGLEAPMQTSKTVDCNGTPLKNGDTITLIKGLDVKGGNFTAKRGTTVKNIRLTDDAELVEGRINKMSIVLKTAFIKRIG